MTKADRVEPVALFSIHDVMPHTLNETSRLIELFQCPKKRRLTLFVVPGLDWRPTQVDQLRRWVDDGHELAGHGWRHHCERIGDLRHRIHSLLISRDVAEHLPLDASESCDLIRRCWDWFARQRLPQPHLYVPPAWALRRLPPDMLHNLPFDIIEQLTGIIWTKRNRFERLPLVGYEADTQLRRCALNLINRWGKLQASWQGAPLRIAVHPYDDQMYLAGQLKADLSCQYQDLLYRELELRRPIGWTD